MKVHYLEIVSTEVDAVCASYAAMLGVTFGGPDPVLGNARTAALSGGGLVGVRAPLRATETAVVRPYFLVDDLDAAVAAAAAAGAEVAIASMELPGRGRIAVFLQGGAEHGLWEIADTAG
ncbi:MAG: hydroxylase [Planctomycetota bacterium]